MGIRGQLRHPRFRAAVERVVAAAEGAGGAADILAPGPEAVTAAAADGFRFVGAGSTLGALSRAGRRSPTLDQTRRAVVNILDRIAAAPDLLGRVRGAGLGRADGARAGAAEMRELGILATEAGPDGYLGDDPDAAAELVRSLRAQADRRLRAHRAAPPGALEPVERAAALFAAAGADVLVRRRRHRASRATTTKPALLGRRVATLLSGLDAAREICAAARLRCALHPHVGTMVEGPEEIDRVL